ncbi:MAG: hypothetical protein F4Y02_12405 [Chloroflexi bacterium]|nr:hypothetical protein [Chloroflexota bacterium]
MGKFCTGLYIVVCNDYVTIKKEVKGNGDGKKLYVHEAFITSALVVTALELRDWIKERLRK